MLPLIPPLSTVTTLENQYRTRRCQPSPCLYQRTACSTGPTPKAPRDRPRMALPSSPLGPLLRPRASQRPPTRRHRLPAPPSRRGSHPKHPLATAPVDPEARGAADGTAPHLRDNEAPRISYTANEMVMPRPRGGL